MVAEISAADFAAAAAEVDAERSEKKVSFEKLAYAFGDSFRTFDTMLNIIKDKSERGANKPRGTEVEDDMDVPSKDLPIYKAMKQHGLLTPRGGISELAYNYLRWVASANMRVPTADDFPQRYRQSTIDRVASTEKMGNFPPAVVSELRQFDNKKTIQSREDGVPSKPNFGDARKRVLNKITDMLPNIKARIADRNRTR